MSTPPPPRPFYRSTAFKALVVLAVVAGLGVVAARLDFSKDLRRLKVAMLSGAPEGNYHAVVDRLAKVAGKARGQVENVASEGSVDNLNRLAAAAKSGCAAQFALIQDGQDWPEAPALELVGRLPRPESVLFLGKDADRLSDFGGLSKMRIGIGPAASGTAKIARQILESPDFAGLSLTLSNHSLAEQLDLAASGGLDLAVMVIDQDTPLVQKAIRERGLQLAGFPGVDVLASRSPHLRAGRLEAGHYDPVRGLPASDKAVLQVDTLVVGNGCAGRSKTVELMSALAMLYPDFILHNKGRPNTTGLAFADSAKSFFDNEGPEVFDEYVPWLVNVMPIGNWMYLITGVSVLFNAMGFGHRFQLWRIDANRVRFEQEVAQLFGPSTTLGDISTLTPSPEQKTPELLASIDRIIHELEALAARSRKQSLSMLVPMGQEMAYRYQEGVIYDTLAVLRAYLKRCR